jgi:hypothetical protein
VISSAAVGSSRAKSFRYRRTGWSSCTCPASTNCITRVAVKTFVFDPIWKTELVVVFTAVSTLTTPVAKSNSSSPCPTASVAPGTW